MLFELQLSILQFILAPQFSIKYLRHSGNDGASPVAVSSNAPVPELAKDPPEKPRVAEIENAMETMILKPPWLYKRAFGAAPPRNV